MSAAWAQIDQRLPDLGDGSSLSVQQERRLGESIVRQLWRDPEVMDDPVLTAYVQTIWTALRASAKDLGNLSAELDESYAWDLLLVRDRTVNAFALPGGYMGVHLGLIAVVSNRDELAAVLGHELSHVTQRHIARMQDSQAKQTPWLVGSFLLGVLAASRSPDAANALIMGGTAGVAQGQLNFSRDMEREADRLGFSVTTHAGFDAQGWQWPMHEPLFQRIQQLNWPLWGGNLPAAQTRSVYQNQGASLPEPIRALIAQATLPEPAMANLRQSIDEGHCGALPAHMFDGMIAVQRARDAHMAQAVLMHTPAVLIAGNGHAWKDVGVPQILQAHRTDLKVMSVLFLEEDPAEPLKPEAASMTAWRHKADYLWVTPAAAREDPCARWPKKQ